MEREGEGGRGKRREGRRERGREKVMGGKETLEANIPFQGMPQLA